MIRDLACRIVLHVATLLEAAAADVQARVIDAQAGAHHERSHSS